MTDHPSDSADMRLCRVRMSRYDGLLSLAESLWQKERASKVPIERV